MNNKFYALFTIFSLFLISCGGGGGGDEDDYRDPYAFINPYINEEFTINGTVPGTLIEAFGENGSYYKTTSTNDVSSSQHPFSLTLKAGVTYFLYMTVNENDPANSVTTPIKFNNNNGQISYKFTASANTSTNLGYINLATNRSNDAAVTGFKEITSNDLEVKVVGVNEHNTWDEDGDGIHNIYDSDYTKRDVDSDGDGVADNVDVNPNNEENHLNQFSYYLDRDNDGYLDDDIDRDGYHDDDHNLDGYHDGDTDFDGYHDDDHDRDGYPDNDNYYSGSSYIEVKGYVLSANATTNTITMNVVYREYTTVVPLGYLVVNASNTYFEHYQDGISSVLAGHFIETKGYYNSTTKEFTAFKVERE